MLVIPRLFSTAIKKFAFAGGQFHRDAVHRNHNTFVGGEDIRRPHVENHGIVPDKRVGILVADGLLCPVW